MNFSFDRYDFKKLVQEGKMDFAILQLMEILRRVKVDNQFKTLLYDELTLLASKIKIVENHYNKGLINFEIYLLESNRASNSMIDIINRIPDSFMLPKKQISKKDITEELSIQINSNETNSVINNIEPIRDRKSYFNPKDTHYKKGNLIERKPMKILIIGEPNVGKSSLINYLIGNSVLPVGYVSNSNKISIITDKKVKYYTEFYSKLSNYKEPEGYDFYSLNSLGIEIENQIIIEIPVLEEFEEVLSQLIVNLNPHIIIYTLDHIGLTKSAKINIEKIKKEIGSFNLIVVINRIDEYEDFELFRLIDFTKSNLDGIIEAHDLFFISSRLALEGKLTHNIKLLQKSRLHYLEKAINKRFGQKDFA